MPDPSRRDQPLNDPLFEQILAEPSNDGPRLVWADREGGERGELVVLQCALARPDVPDRERLERRVGELLLAHSVEWSDLGKLARGVFVRGFVEAIEVTLHALARSGAEIFRRAPLATDVRITQVNAIVEWEEGESLEVTWRERMRMLEAAFASFPPGRVCTLRLKPELTYLDIQADPMHTYRRFDDEVARLAAPLGLESLILE